MLFGRLIDIQSRAVDAREVAATPRCRASACGGPVA